MKQKVHVGMHPLVLAAYRAADKLDAECAALMMHGDRETNLKRYAEKHAARKLAWAQYETLKLQYGAGEFVAEAGAAPVNNYVN